MVALGVDKGPRVSSGPVQVGKARRQVLLWLRQHSQVGIEPELSARVLLAVWVTGPGMKGHQGVSGHWRPRAGTVSFLFPGQTFKEQRRPSGPRWDQVCLWADVRQDELI